MKFELYQIIVAILAILMIVQGFKRFFQKGETTFIKFFTRLVVWGGMMIITLFPKSAAYVAQTIGIKGNVNAVILTGFILVFLMIFKLLSAIERVEKQISILTRKDALKKLDKSTKRKK
jgi:hypothetical protein